MIFGNADLLGDGVYDLNTDEYASALSDIRNEADRLNRIVDNLLVLARLERGMELEREPILVRRVVDAAVQHHQKAFPHRRLEVRWKFPLTPVQGSQQYVEQTLRNLLSNAEKYSPPESPIEIEGRREGSEFIVRVLDSGPGISSDEAASLFTAFYRAPSSANLAQGVGIGLAVCKRLIEALGGRVWVRRRESGGSEFGFALPLA
jgi:two-component system sensor histidine kinase KdpD